VSERGNAAASLCVGKSTLLKMLAGKMEGITSVKVFLPSLWRCRCCHDTSLIHSDRGSFALKTLRFQSSCTPFGATLHKSDKRDVSPLQKSGKVTYNGRSFDEFLPQSASVYIEQEDQHLPELTVRETMDFSALCQGSGHKSGVGLRQRGEHLLYSEAFMLLLLLLLLLLLYSKWIRWLLLLWSSLCAWWSIFETNGRRNDFLDFSWSISNMSMDVLRVIVVISS
jgi:hypothetical protein